MALIGHRGRCEALSPLNGLPPDSVRFAVRVDGDNRLHNTLTDGFENSEKMYHCVGADCIGWRQFHLTHYKGSEEGVQGHGYCGYAGKIELD